MIRAEILGVPAVKARLARIPQQAQRMLTRSIGRLCLQLERKVKQEKLNGQLLHVRSNRLRGSIHSEVSSDDTTVTGIVGTNVEYAAVHEYGFTGTENVRGHIRRLIDTRTHSLTTGKLLKRAVKTVYGSTMVRPHSRQVHIRAKPFLRSSLHEMAPEIQAQLEQSVHDALGGTA